jgi:hypothetical protein
MPSIPSRGYPRDGNHLSSSAKVLLLGLEDRSTMLEFLVWHYRRQCSSHWIHRFAPTSRR